VVFGAVLALGAADASTVGAVAPQLEHAFHIGNAKIGLLSSVSLLVGALFVIPVGLLVDRFKRVPILSASIVLWSAASLASAFATSYEMLLFTRLALGAVTATAGPAIASLTGDYFPARERGRVYSYILAGEAAGTAAGFIVSSSVASLTSWRGAFVLLAIPGVFLARVVWRTVPEPLRGGQGTLDVGAVDFDAAGATAGSTAGAAEGASADPAEKAVATDGLAQRAVSQHGVEPDPKLVLKEDPDQMGLLRAIRYTLRVPTNLVLITSSALGYFYFGGLQTFALLFVRGHYHTSSAAAELVLALLVVGSVVGTLISGRVTDGLLRRGMLNARINVPIVCYLAAAGLLVPGILATRLSPAVWFDVGGAAFLSAANPGLDAARLDIMPSGLWGRAESARTFLRSLGQAAAPLAFGGVSDLIAGIVPAQVPVGLHAGVVSPSVALGLEDTFLVMLISLVAAGLLLIRARRTYPRDIATAAASEEAAARARS
jgi:MFS family permease